MQTLQPQQQHRQNQHQHHHRRQTHQNGLRPTSMESTKSDLSGTTTSSSLPLLHTPPLPLETSSSVATCRDALPNSSPFCRTPVLKTNTKFTGSRVPTNNFQTRDDSSSSTSQSFSTSGIGTCTKYTDSRSGNTLSVNKASSNSIAPTLLDRLPCQLAYAPSTLDVFLDWLLLDSFMAKTFVQGNEQETSACPLGSAFCVYLMLRAICRQCDRWEALENRKMAADTTPGLKTRQNIRRQRELSTLLMAVTDRLVSVGHQMHENCAMEQSTSIKELERRAIQGAAVLSNVSQLLHFISKDIDLQQTFQSGAEGEETGDCQTAWITLTDRVADLVESVFNQLLATLTALIARNQCLPTLTALWDRRANTRRDNPGTEEVEEEEELEEGREEAEIEITDDNTSIDDLSDPVLDELTKILEILHISFVNPAFLVQLFARLLHYIGARLFNGLVEEPARVSTQWGRLLFEWIHNKLVRWAEPHGLRVAVECYLTRLSQAADLMQASTKTVEGLYNTAVDLDRLNSVQVRFLLSAYRPSFAMPLRRFAASEVPSHGISEHIPTQWIDFIISGVSQVSDRLLAEEFEKSDWKPELLEALDLRLPLLLPDDCYPSSTPVKNPHLESDPQILSEAAPSENQSGAVEISQLTAFLRPALLKGWCRLSVRQVPSQRHDTWLSWDVYLATEKPSLSLVNESGTEHEYQRDSPGPKTPPAFEAPSFPVERMSEVLQIDPSPRESTSELGSTNTSESIKVEESGNVRIFNVAVPKIGNSLGLSIIAARSEDGCDLGIYVKAVAPGGGASRACCLGVGGGERPPLPAVAPGDRILAVDGQETRGLSQDAAARLVSRAGSEVHLTLARNLGLGRVAAAVPILDLRKRNNHCLLRRNTTATIDTSQFSSPLTEVLNTSAIENSTRMPVPPRVCDTTVRSTSINKMTRRKVGHVEIQSDGGESESPPSPRVLLETRYLLAHEVPSNTSIQRSRSLMSHDSPSRRLSVDQCSWNTTEVTMCSRASFSDHSIKNHSNRNPTDRDSDQVPRSTKEPPLRNSQASSWEEMDVDSTLEMLKNMRDQLDRSLTLRNHRVAPMHSATPSSLTAMERKSSYAGGLLRDSAESGPFYSTGMDPFLPRQDKEEWDEESSSANRKCAPGIVRSASTCSPFNSKPSSAFVDSKSSSSFVDDSYRNRFFFRTPTATFNSGPAVIRSNTSDRLHNGQKAIYSSRGPFKHNVSINHHNGGQPILGNVNPRSYDFEVEHRRTQSADQTLNGDVDVGRQPCVAERVKLFQSVIENQCK